MVVLLLAWPSLFITGLPVILDIGPMLFSGQLLPFGALGTSFG